VKGSLYATSNLVFLSRMAQDCGSVGLPVELENHRYLAAITSNALSYCFRNGHIESRQEDSRIEPVREAQITL
jgi:hypothetical protein